LTKTISLMAVMVVAGAMAFSVHLLSPVHEWFHSGQALTEGIAVLSQTSMTTTVERLTIRIILAGYWGELVVWSLFALILGKWGTFFAGYWYGAAEEALRSLDFRVHLFNFAFKESGSEAVAQQVVDKNLSNFTTVAVILGIILLVRYIALIRKKALSEERACVDTKQEGTLLTEPPRPL